MINEWQYCPNAASKVMTFTNGPYFKHEVVLNCLPDKAFAMISDKSSITRKQWDPKCGALMQLEEFKMKDGVIYTVKRNAVVGVQWERAPKLVIFKSCYTHPLYKNTASGDIESLTWVTPVDEDKCFVTVISTVRCEYLLLLLEAVNFKVVYGPWFCKICRHNVFAHELECRACKQERYVRCPLKTCFEAQEEGAKKCPYCNTLIV